MKGNLNIWHPRQWVILVSGVVWLLAIVLIASGCTFFGKNAQLSPQAEEAFKSTIGIPIEPQVHLLTDKDQYRRKDWIGIWIENRTGQVLWFTDQRLGLRAYQYDEQKASWQLVELGSTLGNPQVTMVTPGPRSLLPSDAVPVEDIKASGEIRLVITGVTDKGQFFIVYKDIEIVD